MEMTDAENLVLETLRRSTSQNVEVLKSAALKLKEWEIEPGFYSILLKIIANHSIDPTVRWLAATLFKNGIVCYWRKTAVNAIKEKEKRFLRNGLLETFREPVNQVAIQLAVVISKVARYDVPNEWPQLIPSLLELTKSEDLLAQHRGLLILYHVVKVLASKPLFGHRRDFQQLVINIYPYVLNLWNSQFEDFFSQERVNDPQCHTTLERALLLVKTLRRMTINGFKVPDQQCPEIITFMTSVYDRIRRMLYFRKSVENKSPPLTEISEKIIINLIKVFRPILEHHPATFVNFFRPSLEFTVAYLFTAHGDGLLFEKFTVQCIHLLKCIVLCPKCKLSRHMQDPKGPEYVEAHRVKAEFFQPNVLAEICRKLVTHYFLLTRDDLQLWDSDPEGFEERLSSDEEAGASWKVSLRAGAYSLFMELFHEYRESLSVVLLELIQNCYQLVNPNDMDAIVRKDAVYNAMGLAAFELYDEVDFDQWFTTTLLQELTIKDPNYRVIRRRVGWLMGQWAGIKLSPGLRPDLYRALIGLLNAEEDIAVRLSSAMALRRAVDDFQFDSEQFLEFLEPSFSLLFLLLQEVEECDSKLQVLNVLSFIVERMGSAIKPYSQNLVRYLPLLWEKSAGHNMLRCAIVSTLVRFVKGLMTENLSSFLFPVIELCTDMKQCAHVYLLEEGLELWLAVLENSTSLTPELLQLYRNMPTVLEYTEEYLRCCSFIIQAYILLDPRRFLTEYGKSLIDSCLDLFEEVKNDEMVMIMQIVMMALRADPPLAINLSMPVFVKILHRCADSSYNKAHHARMMSMFFAILSRVLLHSFDIFSQLLANAANEKSESWEQLLSKVLDGWLDMMMMTSQKEDLKILALGLISLFTVDSNVVLTRFQSMVYMIVGALNDILDVDNLTTQIDSLAVSPELNSSEELESQNETESDKRKKLLMENDHVYDIEPRGFFKSQMYKLKSRVGETAYEELIMKLDFECVGQCRMYVML